MIDFLLIVAGVLVVVIIACFAHAIEKMGACKHDYGNWEQEETDTAYVQMRACSKCGWVEISQFRKLSEEKPTTTA